MFKKPLLKYESTVEVYPNIVIPAKKNIPEWYKKIPKVDNNEIFTFEEGFKKTVKNCIPFLDSLTTGYNVVLPYDIYVKNDSLEMPKIVCQNAKFPPSSRDKVADLNIVPFEHHLIEFTWKINTAIAVPLGYSFLVTHPLNRNDLPFTTLSGIVDGGLVMDPCGNLPFYIKKGFEGIIPQGTPIAQIIPFKQEIWNSKIEKGLVQKGLQDSQKSLSVIFGWYKKNIWTRKKYN